MIRAAIGAGGRREKRRNNKAAAAAAAASYYNILLCVLYMLYSSILNARSLYNPVSTYGSAEVSFVCYCLLAPLLFVCY